MTRGIRDRLTYANVMATIAVFIALGGTSYALTLPRNSVGSSQLRSDSVGKSELRKGSVRSSTIDDRSIRLRDISFATRNSLRGVAGPPGPAGTEYFAAFNSAGQPVSGNASSHLVGGSAATVVGFGDRPLTACVATATLTNLPGGPNPDPPGTATVKVSHNGDGRFRVETWREDGQPVPYPFNLIVAC
jgi:hypothetical protein